MDLFRIICVGAVGAFVPQKLFAAGYFQVASKAVKHAEYAHI